MKAGKKTGREAENKGGYFSDLHYLRRSYIVDNEYKGMEGMDALCFCVLRTYQGIPPLPSVGRNDSFVWFLHMRENTPIIVNYEL